MQQIEELDKKINSTDFNLQTVALEAQIGHVQVVEELHEAKLRQEQQQLFYQKIIFGALTLIVLIVVIYWFWRRSQHMRLTHLPNQIHYDEKHWIANYLHNTVCTDLKQISMTFHRLKASPENCFHMLDASISELERVEENVRNYSHELYPKEFKRTPLGYYLRQSLTQREHTMGYKTTISIDEKAEEYLQTNYELKKVLYELWFNTLSNIDKHAKAQRVSASLRMSENGLELYLGDNGVGFEPDKVSDGIGLRSIYLHAKRLQIKVEIDSSPGHGSSFWFTYHKKRLSTKLFKL